LETRCRTASDPQEERTGPSDHRHGGDGRGHRLAAGPPDRGGVLSATTDQLEDHEAGRLGLGTTHKPLAELIRTGRAWNSGGPCLNEALHLIGAGYATPGVEIAPKGRASGLDEGREGPRATRSRG
jgi:hypothetical protein